jgi:hypothetical protein
MHRVSHHVGMTQLSILSLGAMISSRSIDAQGQEFQT